MTSAITTTTARTVMISRLILALTVALVMGSMLVPDAGAWKAKTKTPIGVRVEAQLNLCDVQGGTSSVGRTPFGSSTVTCTGGSQGDWKCTNSKKHTSCNPAYTPPPPSPLDDIVAPPPSGVDGDPGGGVILTSNGGGKHHKDSHHGKRKHHRRGHSY
jgi:hypothetical protein